MKVIQKTSSFGISKYIKIATNTRIAGMVSTFMLMIFAGLTIYPIVLKNSNAEATAVPSTTELAIETGKNTASVNLTPISSTGTFAASTSENEAAFTVTTNNLTGYSLNLVGSNNDTTGRLINDDDPTYYIDTLSSDVDETTFSTGAASTYNNKWGYKLTVNGTAGTNYLAAPTTSTKTIHTTTAPNNTTDSFTLGVGVRADYTKPTGTYTNTFVLTAVANPISYQINYLDNTGPNGTTGSDVSGLPAAEGAADITASAFTLSNTVPTRTGYTFNGWCYGTVTHPSGGDSTCSGTVYQAGDNFTFSSIPSAGTAIANLYAMWEENLPYIQDFMSSMCKSQASSDSIRVMDKRDNNKYTVRYINGNCWMTQNLRYVGDTGSTSGNMIMKAATSNISADQTLPYTDLTNGDSYDQARIHDSGNTTNGVWYNYAAASVGTITGDSNENTQVYDICPKGWKLPTGSEGSGVSNYKTQFNPVNGGYYAYGEINYTNYGLWWFGEESGSGARSSLIYTGNSLPVGATDRDTGIYVRCIRNTSSVTVTFDGNGATGGNMTPQVINASGNSNPSGVLNANAYTNGNKIFIGWNTAANGSGTKYANGATYTATTSGDTNVTLYAQWYDGYTMQGLTKTTCQANASSGNISAMDIRDGNLYNVRYINGNCWMTQNLRLAGNTKLYSDTSNVPDGYPESAGTEYYTLPQSSTSGFSDYTTANLYCSGNSTNGCWYNYKAASAGTISGYYSSVEAQYSICPKGWRLPTDSEFQTLISFKSAFALVTGGYYSYGEKINVWFGDWWSSTAESDLHRRNLVYNSSYDTMNVSNIDRKLGIYVRCVRSS